MQEKDINPGNQPVSLGFIREEYYKTLKANYWSLRDKLTIIGSEMANRVRIDPRLIELMSKLDPYITSERSNEVMGYLSISDGCWGGYMAKAGKSKSGDIVFSDKNLTAVIDGVNPANMSPDDRSFWGESADRVGADELLRVVQETFSSFAGNPSPRDLAKGIISRTISKFAGTIPSDVKKNPRASGAFILMKDNRRYIMEIGDIRAVGIDKNGELVKLLHETDEHYFLYEAMYEALDRWYGGLSEVITNPDILKKYVEEYFEIKHGMGLMRIFEVNDNESVMKVLMSYEDIDKSIKPINEDVGVVVMSTDGFCEREEHIPFFAFLPYFFSKNYHINGINISFSNSIRGQYPLIFTREIYKKNPGSLERKKGVVDDDCAYAVKILIPDGISNKKIEHAISKAFLVSQRHLLKFLEDRGIIPGARIFEAEVFRKEKEIIYQIAIKNGVSDENAQQMAEQILVESMNMVMENQLAELQMVSRTSDYH